MSKLPHSLNIVPIIDAVCEFRFEYTELASSFLLSAFMNKFGPHHKIKKTGAASIPDALRKQEVSLKYQPLMIAEWAGHTIGLGDSSLIIACKLPYPGWAEFKRLIFKTMEVISSTSMIGKLERCGLKYVNLLEGRDAEGKLSLCLKLNNVDETARPFNLNLDFTHSAELTTLVRLSNKSEALLKDGRRLSGTLIEVDTVSLDVPGLEVFDKYLEELHSFAKGKFFECLSQQTLQEMGPHYD